MFSHYHPQHLGTIHWRGAAGARRRALATTMAFSLVPPWAVKLKPICLKKTVESCRRLSPNAILITLKIVVLLFIFFILVLELIS